MCSLPWIRSLLGGREINYGAGVTFGPSGRQLLAVNSVAALVGAEGLEPPATAL